MNYEHKTVVDFLIVDPQSGKLLIQKRYATRKLFPNRWEIPGGHLEDGESPIECIKRELSEELGLTLTGTAGKIHAFSWPNHTNVTNEVHLITASGSINLEEGKASDYRWIDKNDATLLLGKEEETNGLYEALLKAFVIIQDAPVFSLHQRETNES